MTRLAFDPDSIIAGAVTEKKHRLTAFWHKLSLTILSENIKETHQ